MFYFLVGRLKLFPTSVKLLSPVLVHNDKVSLVLFIYSDLISFEVIL